MFAPEPHILIADDEGNIGIILQRVVRLVGLTGVVVSDGTAAIETARTLQESLVCAILDVRMPGSNGVEVAEQIRQFAPTIPIILMSGLASPHIAERAKAIAHLTFLMKPFTIPKFRSVLGSILEEQYTEAAP